MDAEPLVAVVDDDDAVRDSVDILLSTSGFRVEAFASPVAFLESGAAARCACLLTDVRMPEMTGIEVQEHLAKAGHALPVIVMTGHGDVPLAVKAMKAGAVDFIEKPFEEETLLASIRAALARPRSAPAPEVPSPAAAAAEPPAEVAARLALLTPRERDVLQGLVEGKPNKIIAFELSISARTVEIHRARVMDKMQAPSLPHLVRMALAAGVAPRGS